jgi:hypothetical protein
MLGPSNNAQRNSPAPLSLANHICRVVLEPTISGSPRSENSTLNVRRADPARVCIGSVPRTIADGGFLAAQQKRVINDCKVHGLLYGGDKQTLRGRLSAHYNTVAHAPMPRARPQPSESF